MALAEYQQLVADLMADQEAGALPADVRDRAIEQARIRYSADCLRAVVVDIDWPRTGVFAPAPEGWSQAAWIKEAEYPIGQQPRRLVQLAAFARPDGWELESLDAIPESAVVRLSYTTAHTIDASTDTVPSEHQLPVAQFAAYLLCQQLATRYSAERETAIGADMSLTETRARAYAARAKEFRSAYYVGIGKPDPYAKGADVGTATGPAASVGSWPGRRRGLLTRGAQ